MENNIVLIHAGIAVLFVLYLLVRILISIFGLNNPEYQGIMRRKFRIPDYVFLVLLFVTGMYPIIALGKIELYHILKLLFLIFIFWSSRMSKMNFTGASFIGLILLIASGYTSFTDTPTFPKERSSFEKDHPEIIGLSVVEKGAVIFNSKCAECHGRDGKKGRFQAADLTKSSLPFDDKVETVKDGVPLTVMRSFSMELSEEEITAVVSYVEEVIRSNR